MRARLTEEEKSFIEHNENVFGKTRSAGNSRILVEAHSFFGSDIGFSYLVRVLAEKSGSKPVAFQPSRLNRLTSLGWFIRFWREFSWGYSPRARVYFSFGVEGFIYPVVSVWMQRKANKLADKWLETIKTKAEVLDFRVGDLKFGDLLYDSYLKKYRVPTIDLNSREFARHVRDFTGTCLFWMTYCDRNHVTSVVVSHTVYEHGIPLRIVLSQGGMAFEASHHDIYRLSAERPLSRCGEDQYPEIFRRLPVEVTAQGIIEAKKRIKRRFEGEPGVDMPYSEVSAFSKPSLARVLRPTPRPKVVITPHDFFDAPHGNGDGLFPDFWEWLLHLGELSKETQFDWYLKPHPDGKEENNNFLEKFLSEFTHIKPIPSTTSFHQLVNEGLSAVLTVHGTVGFELPLLGVPVINASPSNPHRAYEFSYTPQTVAEYDDYVRRAPSLDARGDDPRIIEFYFMSRIFFGPPVFFPHKETDFPSRIAANRGDVIVLDYLSNFEIDRHFEYVDRIRKFIDHGDYRFNFSQYCDKEFGKQF